MFFELIEHPFFTLISISRQGRAPISTIFFSLFKVLPLQIYSSLYTSVSTPLNYLIFTFRGQILRWSSLIRVCNFQFLCTLCLWDRLGGFWIFGSGREPVLSLGFYGWSGKMVLDGKMLTVLVVLLLDEEGDIVEKCLEVGVFPVEGGWERKFAIFHFF